MGYVIIGNSAAAIGCVEGIRSVDKTGEITLLSQERFHTYSRPLISYLLEGKTDLERMKYRPDSFYRDMGVDARLGGDGHGHPPPGSTRWFAPPGEEIPYDKLLVATGSAPFVPAIQGLEEVERKFTFLSLEDAQALEAAPHPGVPGLYPGGGADRPKVRRGHRTAGEVGGGRRSGPPGAVQHFRRDRRPPGAGPPGAAGDCASAWGTRRCALSRAGPS